MATFKHASVAQKSFRQNRSAATGAPDLWRRQGQIGDEGGETVPPEMWIIREQRQCFALGRFAPGDVLTDADDAADLGPAWCLIGKTDEFDAVI